MLEPARLPQYRALLKIFFTFDAEGAHEKE